MDQQGTFKSSTDGAAPAPNTILNSNKQDFFISHNDRDIAIYGGETTSVVVGQMEAFYILNGDHRDAFKKLILEGFGSCMKYFLDNIELINHRSDTLIRPVMK